MSPRIVIPIIIILAVISGFFIYPAIAEKAGLDFLAARPYKLGLDLKGGTHLVYQADVSGVPSDDRDDAMEGLKSVIVRRVEDRAFGTLDPEIRVDKGSHRLFAELPGVLYISEAIRLIGETPFLEFKELRRDIATSTATTTENIHEQFISTELSGEHLKTPAAISTLDPTTGQPLVLLEFNDEGEQLFAEITERNIGQPLAIYLDGKSIVDVNGDGEITEEDLYAPIVQGKIEGGTAQITGFNDPDEAKRLAENLKAGALPVPIELISQQTVGPTLGAESLEQSLFAGLVGFLAVIVYMILYYRFGGVIVGITLILYLVFTLALFKLIGFTFTLPGIVGMILTVGMAADANILILERLKEELRAERGFKIAVAEAYRHAWTAIRDANITTIMVGIVLLWVLRGYAISLVIGLVTSLVAAMVITRVLLRASASTGLAERKSL